MFWVLSGSSSTARMLAVSQICKIFIELIQAVSWLILDDCLKFSITALDRHSLEKSLRPAR